MTAPRKAEIHANIESENVGLTDEQRLDWLRLIRSDNVGPRGIMEQPPQALGPERP
jgi:hypothetical protein